MNTGHALECISIYGGRYMHQRSEPFQELRPQRGTPALHTNAHTCTQIEHSLMRASVQPPMYPPDDACAHCPVPLALPRGTAVAESGRTCTDELGTLARARTGSHIRTW